MTTIWKYHVPITDYFTLDLPIGSKLLTAQVQNGEPCLWALVAPHRESVTRRFCVAGTGTPIEGRDLTYVSTFQQSGGALVWHLFEINRG